MYVEVTSLFDLHETAIVAKRDAFQEAAAESRRRRAQLLLPWAHAKRRARMAMREAGAARFSREVGEPKGAVPLGNKERKVQTSINGSVNHV